MSRGRQACAVAAFAVATAAVGLVGARAAVVHAHARPAPLGADRAVSFDVRVAPRQALSIGLGAGRAVVLTRGATGALVIRAARRAQALEEPAAAAGDLHHVELTTGPRVLLSIDGRAVAVGRRAGGHATLRGSAHVSDLVVTPSRRTGELLLQRLTALHAATPPGRFPLGTGVDGRLRFDRGWTSGFWPGALWDADALSPAGGMFRRWALQATLANLGRERSPIHDVGFIYGRSSLAGYRRLCTATRHPPAVCPRLRASVIAAADTLVRLAATNAAAGTLPTDAAGPTAETIVDSLMNLEILPWAGRATGRPVYANLARDDARLIAARLLRPDGAAIQSMLDRRTDGTLLGFHRRQGLTATSAWARGQGWAVAGFADLGRELRDRGLVADSERVARFVAAHLPASGVPPWDYDAGRPARPDVSAAAITAAGLFGLDAACRALRSACSTPRRWAPLARRMLAGTLRHVADTPPLGVLGGQVYTLGGRTSWDDDAELIFGIDYALQAVIAASR